MQILKIIFGGLLALSMLNTVWSGIQIARQENNYRLFLNGVKFLDYILQHKSNKWVRRYLKSAGVGFLFFLLFGALILIEEIFTYCNDFDLSPC